MQTLLVVDDSRVDRRLVGGLLQKTGEYEVIYAENGRDALQRLELDIPDAVLTDLHMPELNGLELVQAIKRDYPLIPVLLMTAQGSEELAVEALRLVELNPGDAGIAQAHFEATEVAEFHLSSLL